MSHVMGYSAAIEISPIDQPPSHLPEAVTLSPLEYFHMFLSSRFLSVHNGVDTDSHVIAFASNKRCGLVDIRQRERTSNVTAGSLDCSHPHQT